ncbi:MAG: DNA primase [Syntrophus sp. SKADARSKE-3]|nr:DNA primase [Syntrophus sp. SKADARSKE-3]
MGIAAKHIFEAQRVNIARKLFVVKSEESAKGEIHGYCPIHQESEKSHSPSFSYNYKKDSYHCFSCGADGDLLRLWTEVRGYNQKEGFKAFCEAYDIPYGKDAPDAKPKVQAGKKDDRPDVELTIEQTLELMRQAWEKFPSLPSDWITRFEKERGWSSEIIKQLDIRLQTYRLDKKTGKLSEISNPSKVAIPIFDEQGALRNIRLYEPGAEQFKIISFAKTSGDSRLFPAKPLHEGAVFLCEGESDTICALSHGFNAITQTAKLKTWTTEHLRPFHDLDIVIAYDADNPGSVYADYAGECLKKVAKSVRMITWPQFMGVGPDGSLPKDHGQDLTDFFVRHCRSNNDFIDLVSAAKPWSPLIPPPPSDDGLPPDDDDVRQFWDYGITKRYAFKPRLLADKICNDLELMFDPGPGILYEWNGKYWQEIAREYIEEMALRYLKNEADESKVKNACYQARTLSAITKGREVNDRKEFVCLQNGMLNIDTFEIFPHDKDYLSTFSLPVSLDPESTKRCENFERFLETSVQDSECIAQMQEYAGYIITRNTKYQKCLFLLGPGRDGKSVFINAIIDMIGSENVSAVSFADLEKEFARSSLYNTMLNVSTEIGNSAIESPYFKAITGGDVIQAAFKHKDNFSFKPYCKLLFAGNQLPRIRDNSDALFERILPIKFRRQFLEGDPDRDIHLSDKLHEERSEIFYWALCGLKRLRDQGRFSDSSETRKLMMEFRRSNNPILCFVEEKCSLGDGLEIEKEALYKEYTQYASRNGYQPNNSNTFFRELYSAVGRLKSYQARHGASRPRVVEGIGLKTVVEQIG